MDFLKQIDKKTVISTALGVALFGVAIWAANKSGVSVAQDAAKIAQGR